MQDMFYINYSHPGDRPAERWHCAGSFAELVAIIAAAGMVMAISARLLLDHAPQPAHLQHPLLHVLLAVLAAVIFVSAFAFSRYADRRITALRKR
jgi:drug/metabolite transporter (DMT)-like permease